MLDSFKQVDWVMNTLWMLFYSVALLLFLGLFWKEYINDFRKQNATYRREEVLVSETHKQYTAVLAQKNNYENNNSTTIHRIHNPLSSASLQSIFGQSSKGVAVKNMDDKNKQKKADTLPDGIQENFFQVSGVVRNTKELKSILHSLQNSNYAVEISFPIRFEKTKTGLKYLISIKSFSKSASQGVAIPATVRTKS